MLRNQFYIKMEINFNENYSKHGNKKKKNNSVKKEHNKVSIKI